MGQQLMLAAYYGHADLVKFLIEHGADPNRLNDKKQSPIAGAVFKKLDNVVQASSTAVPHMPLLSKLELTYKKLTGSP